MSMSKKNIITVMTILFWKTGPLHVNKQVVLCFLIWQPTISEVISRWSNCWSSSHPVFNSLKVLCCFYECTYMTNNSMFKNILSEQELSTFINLLNFSVLFSFWLCLTNTITSLQLTNYLKRSYILSEVCQFFATLPKSDGK